MLKASWARVVCTIISPAHLLASACFWSLSLASAGIEDLGLSTRLSTGISLQTFVDIVPGSLPVWLLRWDDSKWSPPPPRLCKNGRRLVEHSDYDLTPVLWLLQTIVSSSKSTVSEAYYCHWLITILVSYLPILMLQPPVRIFRPLTVATRLIHLLSRTHMVYMAH